MTHLYNEALIKKISARNNTSHSHFTSKKLYIKLVKKVSKRVKKALFFIPYFLVAQPFQIPLQKEDAICLQPL